MKRSRSVLLLVFLVLMLALTGCMEKEAASPGDTNAPSTPGVTVPSVTVPPVVTKAPSATNAPTASPAETQAAAEVVG